MADTERLGASELTSLGILDASIYSIDIRRDYQVERLEQLRRGFQEPVETIPAFVAGLVQDYEDALDILQSLRNKLTQGEGEELLLTVTNDRGETRLRRGVTPVLGELEPPGHGGTTLSAYTDATNALLQYKRDGNKPEKQTTIALTSKTKIPGINFSIKYSVSSVVSSRGITPTGRDLILQSASLNVDRNAISPQY